MYINVGGCVSIYISVDIGRVVVVYGRRSVCI